MIIMNFMNKGHTAEMTHCNIQYIDTFCDVIFMWRSIVIIFCIQYKSILCAIYLVPNKKKSIWDSENKVVYEKN